MNMKMNSSKAEIHNLKLLFYVSEYMMDDAFKTLKITDIADKLKLEKQYFICNPPKV